MINYLKFKWQQWHLMTHGYCLVRGFFSPEMVHLTKSFIDLTFSYNLRKREGATDYLSGDIECVEKNIFDDSLLLHYQPIIEKYFEASMVPSYIFTREYFHGSELYVHTDRDPCQYSVSVTLYDNSLNGSSLIFYDHDESNPKEIKMREGDAIIFSGAQAYGGRPHSRPMVQDGSIVTTFLHYVDVSNSETAQHSFPRPNYRLSH